MISSINSGSPVLDGYGYLSGSEGLEKSDSDQFLQLLVAQLKNQNPLEPLGNEEFIQQIASFSSLEETAKLNRQLTDLIDIQELVAGQNAFTQSASLVGKFVEYTDPTTGEKASGHVDAVHLENGALLLEIGGVSVPVGAVTGIIDVDAPDDATDDVSDGVAEDDDAAAADGADDASDEEDEANGNG